jgi:hypothetical protein
VDAFLAGDPQSDESGDPQTNVGLAGFGRRSDTRGPICFIFSGPWCFESTSCRKSLSEIGRAVRMLLRRMHFWPVTRNRALSVPCEERRSRTARTIDTKFGGQAEGHSPRSPGKFGDDRTTRSKMTVEQWRQVDLCYTAGSLA